MGDDFKLQSKHYYIAIALLSCFLFIFAVDGYYALHYEEPYTYDKSLMWESYEVVTLKQVELYYELGTDTILYHTEGDYENGWEVTE